MSILDKDIESLHKEQEHLSTRISRLSLLRLTLLVILVISISNAFDRLESTEIRRKLIDFYIQSSLLNYPTRPSDEFYYLIDDPFEDLEADSPTPSPEPTVQPAPSPTPEKSPDEIRKEIEFERELREKREQIEKEINNVLREAFLLKFPVLGAGVEIDLRFWINSLPFLFIFSEAYLFILRKKRKLIQVLASDRVRIEKENASKLDKLLFSNDVNKATPYSKYPLQLESVAYVTLNLMALGFFVDAGNNLWIKWDSWRQIQFLLMIFTASFYAIAYCHYASNNMERQVALITEWTPKPSLIGRLWNLSKKITYSIASRFKPNVSLTTGSLLVLSTLFLSMASSCFTPPQKGYKLFIGESWWYTATLLDYWMGTFRPIGRIIYIASIMIAVITLVLLLISLAYRRLISIRRLNILLFMCSGIISLFLFSDFSFSMFWYRDRMFLPRLASWVVPVFLWLTLAFSNNSEKKSRWGKWRPILTVFFIPLVISACVFLIYAYKSEIKGIPIFFLGSQLLTLGYMQFAKRVDSTKEQEEKQ